MEENNSNNESQNSGGNKNGECQDIMRDEKGRFVKGFSNPGRPRKSLEPLTLEQIEAGLQKDLSNSDPKIRHNATKIYLMLKKQMGPSTNSETIDPLVQAALQGYTDDLFSVEDIQEVDEDDI